MALCAVGVAYTTIPKLENPVVYLNITPEIGTKLSMYRVNSSKRGTNKSVHDEENKRLLNFYDHGSDGELDAVMIRGSGAEHIVQKLSELEKWTDIYKNLGAMQSGEYECPWEIRPRDENVRYINKSLKSIEGYR